MKKIIFSVLFLVVTIAANAQSWNYVGPRRFTPNEADNESIVIDTNGTPFLVYVDFSTDSAIVVKFNGTDWEQVGNTNVFGGAPTITIDHNNNPYIIFSDENDTSRTSVKKYDGTNWVYVGNPGFSQGIAGFTCLAFGINDTLFACFSDQGVPCIPKAHVMKFNGTNWVDVGNPRFSGNITSGLSIAMAGNTPYVNCSDSLGVTQVMKFDGSNWVPVGISTFTIEPGENYSIATDTGGTPYVVFPDLNNSYKATVMKFNGTSWVNVGVPGFTPGLAGSTVMAFDKWGTPYVAYEDSSTTHFFASVMKFNGTSWEQVGPTGFSGAFAIYLCLAIDKNGIPYVGYQDLMPISPFTRKASVMRFAIPTVIDKIQSNSANTLSVFPNPTHGGLTLHLNSPENDPAAISITNILGEKVKGFILPVNVDTHIQLDVQVGVYFITANTFQGMQTVSVSVK